MVLVEDADWKNLTDLRSVIRSADEVVVESGRTVVVFNIGGNKYRLVTRVLYPSQKVFILKLMTHKEYDEDKWKDDCGCFAGPPGRSVETKRKAR